MKVRKEILPPGVFTYVHGKTGQPAKLTVTEKDNHRYAESGNAMLSSGLSIPVPLEHQPDAVPMSPAEKAAWQTKHNTGWVEKFEVENGKLFAQLEIADPDIAKKLPNTIKFVSPHINSFMDGNGRRWDNVITHVALTTRPRITNQSPFPNLQAALSTVGALPMQTPQAAAALSEGVSISAAGLLDPMGKPVYPIAFSLATGVKLAAEEVDEIVEEDEEPDGDEDVAVEETPAAIPDLNGNGEADAGDLAIEEAIMHLLKVLGHNPPPMNKATFKRDLYETLMSALQDKVSAADAPAEPDDAIADDEMLDATETPVIKEQPNMFASLDEVKAIKDPEQRRLAEFAFRVQQERDRERKRADAAALSLIADAQKIQHERIARITKGLPKDRRTKANAQIEAMRKVEGAALSLADDGKVHDPLDAALALAETLVLDLPVLLSSDRTSVVKQPQPKDGVLTPERRNELVEQMANR